MRYPWPWRLVWAGVQVLFWLGGVGLVRRRWRVDHSNADRSAVPEESDAYRSAPQDRASADHAISFFRPLKTYDASRLGDLLRFVEQLQPGDEVIFGLEETEAMLTPSLATLAGRDQRIKVVR